MTNRFLTAEEFVQNIVDAARKAVNDTAPEKTPEEREILAMKVAQTYIGAACPMDAPMRMG